MNNIHKFLLFLITTALLLYTNGCQRKIEKPKDFEEKIIQLDKEGWEAWKNKNGDWFAQNTTKDFISISTEGISNKEQVISATVSDCNVKNYLLSNIKFTMLSDKSALITYTVDQEGMCGGSKLNSKIRVAANYIYQNNKWLEAFYMESKIE